MKRWAHPEQLSFHNLKGHTGAFKNAVKGAFGVGAFVRPTSKALPEDRILLCVFCVGGGLQFALLKVTERRTNCSIFPT